MKEDRLYKLYINHLESMLADGKITVGVFSLMRISGQKFEQFKKKMEGDKLFEMGQIESFRDRKIDGIFDDID